MPFHCFETPMAAVMSHETLYKECHLLIYREDKMLEVILISHFSLPLRVSKHNTHGVNISYRGGQHDQHIHVCCLVFQGLVSCDIKILSTKDLQQK